MLHQTLITPKLCPPLIEHTQASAQFVTKEGGKEEHDGLRLWNENDDILQTG